MQKANPLYQALKSGLPAFGAWHMLPGTHLARTLASTGANWVCIDCEHGQLSDSHMHDSVVAISGIPSCSPIIRIPAAQPWMVKRAVDAGAHAIMVPLLQTAAEAKDFVRATKFPPRGMRGFGSPFPMGAFKTEKEMDAVQYLQEANDAIVTIVQIETREALANIKEIAAVEGVDVLFVGPFDLGNNIGRPIIEADMHEDLETAIETVRKAAKDSGKKSGIYCTSGEQGQRFADQGFHMVSRVFLHRQSSNCLRRTRSLSRATLWPSRTTYLVRLKLHRAVLRTQLTTWRKEPLRR